MIFWLFRNFYRIYFIQSNYRITYIRESHIWRIYNYAKFNFLVYSDFFIYKTLIKLWHTTPQKSHFLKNATCDGNNCNSYQDVFPTCFRDDTRNCTADFRFLFAKLSSEIPIWQLSLYDKWSPSLLYMYLNIWYRQLNNTRAHQLITSKTFEHIMPRNGRVSAQEAFFESYLKAGLWQKCHPSLLSRKITRR